MKTQRLYEQNADRKSTFNNQRCATLCICICVIFGLSLRNTSARASNHEQRPLHLFPAMFSHESRKGDYAFSNTFWGSNLVASSTRTVIDKEENPQHYRLQTRVVDQLLDNNVLTATREYHLNVIIPKKIADPIRLTMTPLEMSFGYTPKENKLEIYDSKTSGYLLPQVLGPDAQWMRGLTLNLIRQVEEGVTLTHNTVEKKIMEETRVLRCDDLDDFGYIHVLYTVATDENGLMTPRIDWIASDAGILLQQATGTSTPLQPEITRYRHTLDDGYMFPIDSIEPSLSDIPIELLNNNM